MMPDCSRGELRYREGMRLPFGTLLAASLASAAMISGAMPALVRAADPSPPALPSEPGEHQLDGDAYGAVVADLDGDGVRELVRLVPQADAPSRQTVQVWRIGSGGEPRLIGAAALRRGASVDETLNATPKPDGDAMYPLLTGEPVRLVVWHEAGHERVLVATLGAPQGSTPCCLTLWGLGVGARNAGVRLTLLMNTRNSASSIRALDMDGDGTDELFVTVIPEARAPSEVPVQILRWQGSGFGLLRGRFVAPPGWQAFVPGESDGRPGAELLVSADRVDGGPGAVLYRFALVDGKPSVETYPVPGRGQLVALPADAGPRLLLVPTDTGATWFIDWPAGGSPSIRRGGAVGGRVLGTLGSGGRARAVLELSRGAGTSVQALDANLRPDPPRSMSVGALRFFGNALAPYAGMLPGGLPDDQEAIISGGRLVTPAGPGSTRIGAVAISGMAALPGVVPIGLAGPGERWAVLYAQPGYDPSRAGGELRLDRSDGGRLTIVPLELVLAAEEDDGKLSAAFPGLVVEPGDGGDPRYLSGQRAVTLQVTVPPGSLVTAYDAESGRGPLVRDAPATAVTLRVEASDASVERGRLELAAMVVTPAGHGYAGRWTVDLRLQPPPLTAAAAAWPLSLAVPISGDTAPGATVLVDGQRAVVDAAGSFTASVRAALLPRDVRIEATDPVGNRAELLLSVVAPFDYRRLPWIPIVAVLTLAAGAFLLLRVPRPRADPPRPPDDDARLEEIDHA